MSSHPPSSPARASDDVTSALFSPVRSQTAFEETMERLGTAIKLGLLAPGTRPPAERDLCEQLGIARSTLRQALTALVQSGHLKAVRGRGGGTFVADEPPLVEPPTPAMLVPYRQADVRFHVGLTEATRSAQLLAAMTEAQGAMADLMHHVAHPREVLAWSNGQHARLVDCLERHDPGESMQIMAEHLRGTEHVLAGRLPEPAA